MSRTDRRPNRSASALIPDCFHDAQRSLLHLCDIGAGPLWCAEEGQKFGIKPSLTRPAGHLHCENRRFHPAGERIEAWRMLVTETLGTSGHHPGQADPHDVPRQDGSKPARPCEPPVQGSCAEQALGFRFHLCGHLARLRLRGLRHRGLRAPDCRLAGEPDGACRVRPRCFGTGAS